MGHGVDKEGYKERHEQGIDVMDVGEEKVGGRQSAELVEGAEVR